MPMIMLSDGSLTQVDDVDYEYLSRYNWSLNDWGYVRSWTNNKTIFMHILVAQRMALDCSNEIDHKDRNKRNNQRENLRPCTKSQAGANRDKWSNTTSNYKGVSWNARDRCWQASIRYRRKYITLGYFDDEIKAARKYNYWAVKYFGEFACLNQLPDE